MNNTTPAQAEPICDVCQLRHSEMYAIDVAIMHDRAQEDAVKLDASDVTVKPLAPRVCDDCDDAPATHAVWFDLRNNGHARAMLHGCESCCAEFASRLRASLPADEPTPAKKDEQERS